MSDLINPHDKLFKEIELRDIFILLELKPPPLVAVMVYGFALRIFLFFAALAAP